MASSAGNTTWINWTKLNAQIDAATGKEPPPLGPHRMHDGLIYTVVGNVANARPSYTSSGRPMVHFDLRRKEMQTEITPLPCVAFGRAAEHLGAFLREHGIDHPVLLIGTYQHRDAEIWRFLVSRSGLPRLHQAIGSAVRLGEHFEHAG